MSTAGGKGTAHDAGVQTSDRTAGQSLANDADAVIKSAKEKVKQATADLKAAKDSLRIAERERREVD